MQKESKIQLSQMMSLMERMDKHYTGDQAKMLLENDLKSKSLIKEKIEESDRDTTVQIDNNTYSLSDPNELVKIMTKPEMSPAKNWFVTLGYVEGFSKLGDEKKIGNNIPSFNKEVSDRVKGMGFDRLNNIIDNPTIIDKGQNKGNIRNPYMPDTNSNFIVRVDKLQLMYGRNEIYNKQKQGVENDLAAYQEQHPEDIKHYSEYMASKGHPIVDFAKQSYDTRGTSKARIPDTNIYQYDDGSYEMAFNTPLKAFKRLKTSYFLITDENTVEEISEQEAKAYAELFGVEVSHKVADTDEIVSRVDKFIKDTKEKHHGGDLWTQYKLNSIFLLNFATEGGQQKLQYYNPNAIVRFVKGRELKSGSIPSRYTASGVFKPHLEKMKQ